MISLQDLQRIRECLDAVEAKVCAVKSQRLQSGVDLTVVTLTEKQKQEDNLESTSQFYSAVRMDKQLTILQ